MPRRRARIHDLQFAIQLAHFFDSRVVLFSQSQDQLHFTMFKSILVLGAVLAVGTAASPGESLAGKGTPSDTRQKKDPPTQIKYLRAVISHQSGDFSTPFCSSHSAHMKIFGLASAESTWPV
jgi:hypothetical protein